MALATSTPWTATNYVDKRRSPAAGVPKVTVRIRKFGHGFRRFDALAACCVAARKETAQVANYAIHNGDSHLERERPAFERAFDSTKS